MRSLFTFLCLLSLAFSSPLVHAQYIYTFAGNGFGASTGVGGYKGDNSLAPSAELNAPTGVTFDGAGNVYIADRGNNVVRKVNMLGVISTYAGTGVAGYSGDKGAATAAKLNQPYGVATDADGNLYISDFGNHVIRLVNHISGKITTFAGTGTAGYSGDLGPATGAKLNGPAGICIDSLGNLFIADPLANVVREVYITGTIYTLAGTGTSGFSGDGGFSTNAKLAYPISVAVDPFDQVYIADYNNARVRKVDTSGYISTFAGNGSLGHGGDGHAATAAQLFFPVGVSVFGFGNVFISDEGNNAVRMVNSAGIITTYAGTFTNGYTGDGGFAASAQLSSPKGIAVDSRNFLYITDYDNNVIRIVRNNTGIGSIGNESSLSVYPNPSNGSFTIQLPAITSDAAITITDILGHTIAIKQVAPSASTQTININKLAPGNYFIRVTAGDNTWHQQVQVQ